MISKQAETPVCTKNRTPELNSGSVLVLATGWLDIEALKAHEVKSTCMKLFLTLIDMTNFVLTLLTKTDSPRSRDQQRT